MSYDFTDDQILNLVRATHTPIEVNVTKVDVDKPDEPWSLLMVCAADRNPWPCPAVVEMREHLLHREGRGNRLGQSGRVTAAERVEQLISEGKLRG